MSWLQDLADYWGLKGGHQPLNDWTHPKVPNDQHLRALIDCQAALGDDLAVGGSSLRFRTIRRKKMRFSSLLELHSLQSRKAWMKSASQKYFVLRELPGDNGYRTFLVRSA